MAGLFGLGGISGIGGAQPPAGLLGPYFNQADMRKQQLKQGLLAAGIGLLQGGKGSTGEVLGQGLAAGLQGANNAGINYKQDAMGYNKMAQDMEAQRAKEEEKKRLMDWVAKQPPEMQNFLAVNPEAGAKLWQEQKIKGMFPGGEGGVKRGLVPQYGVDAQGNPVLLQLGDDATAAQTKMPAGVTLSKAPIKLDAGTHWVLLDPITRQSVGTIPKELAEAEAQKEIGAGRGKQIAAAPSDVAAADEALNLIDQIATDPNLDWGVGMTSLGNMIPGTPGRDFQSRVDQAKSGAFLSAIQQLRGMGSLSNAEGDTATKAVTRLNTATSKEEFLSALSDYKKVVQMGRARAAARIPGGAQAPVNQAPPMPTQAPSVDDLVNRYRSK